jgi:dihydrodipicolinate synthase/N-acetylneuraminate lyase
MSLVIKFYFTSSMLNMFRRLIHPLSGACDFSILSPHWSCVLVSMCVGVTVWLGWGGIRVAGSSGACDFTIVSPHWSCVLVSMCVGVSVWLGWDGIRVAGS